jgi:D-alanyl-D-alanine carboxypeptidase
MPNKGVDTMNTKKFAQLAASGAMLLMVSGGCSLPNALGFGPSSESTPTVKDAAKASKKSMKLMEKGNLPAAIEFAEQAVAAAPQDSGYRAQLGHNYLADGRFLSAEMAFRDAMTLGDTSARTVISLSLSLTAQGKVDEARGVLTAHRSTLPAADYGLALALLGDHEHAIEILVDAVRNAPPSAKTRQNLALAFALAGRWPEAKMMGEQDLAPEALRERMTEWAQLARPGAYEMRVASLLGVSPREDMGMPVRLALNGGGATYAAKSIDSAERVGLPVNHSSSLSAIGPAPLPGGATNFADAEPDMKVTATRMEPAPMAVAPMAVTPMAPKPVMAAKPASMAPIAAPVPVKPVAKPAAAPRKLSPIVEDRDASPKKPASLAAKPAPKPAAKPAVTTPKPKMEVAAAKPKAAPKVAPKSGGNYIVQLGAYSSVDAANKAWGAHTKRYPVLGGFGNASSTATVNGKKVYRLAAMGFNDFGSANNVCKQVKAKGGDCMVKKVDGVKTR